LPNEGPVESRIAARAWLVALAVAWLGLVTPAMAQEIPPLVWPEDGIIGGIRFEGTAATEDELRALIASRAAENLDAETISADIRALYATGRFEDIEVETLREGLSVILVFHFVERPRLRELLLPEALEPDRVSLMDKSKLQVGSFVAKSSTVTLRAAVVESLGDEGLSLADVELVPLEVSAGQVDLQVVAAQLEPVSLCEVLFVGNQAFDDDTLLALMESQPASVWGRLFGGGRLKPRRLQSDVQRLEAYYAEHGFVEARVRLAYVAAQADARGVIAQVRVEEGVVTTVSALGLFGGVVDGELELSRDALALQTGSVFSLSAFQTTIEQLRRHYLALGYALVEVRPTRLRAAEGSLVLNLEVVPGPLVHVRDLLISGNSATAEDVIRREITQDEGALFDGEALRESMANLEATGLFETPSYEVKPVSKGLTDVLVTVKEKDPFVRNLSLAYGTTTGFGGRAQMGHRNLFGLGKRLWIEGWLSQLRQSAELTYEDRRLLGTRMGWRVRALYDNRIYPDFSSSELGGDLRWGVELHRWLLFDIDLGWTQERLSHDFEVVPPALAALFADGRRVSVGASLRFERGDPDEPFHHSHTLSAAIADSAFGSELEWTRLDFDNRFSLALPAELRLGGHVRGTKLFDFNATGEIPLSERLFAGGPADVRGFKAWSLGPHESLDGTNRIAVGGVEELLFSLSLDWSVSESVDLFTFCDAGNVFDANQARFAFDLFSDGDDVLRTAAGFGVRAKILSLEAHLGFPLSPRPGEDGWTFALSAAQPF